MGTSWLCSNANGWTGIGIRDLEGQGLRRVPHSTLLEDDQWL